MSDVGNYAGTIGRDAAIGSAVPGIGTAIGAGVGVLEGGIQLFSSLEKEKKDKEALRKIADPFFKIQDEFLQNKNLAEGQAQSGLPTATKDYLTGESQRGLSAGISGVLQSGGSPNDINKLFDTYNKSIDRTAAEDAQMQQKNIDYFMGVNKDLAGEKIKQWAINKYQPTQEKKKALSENIAADTANAYSGANTLAGSASAVGIGADNNNLLKQLFKTGGTNDAGVSYSTTEPVAPYNPSMVSSTGYIDPNVKLNRNNG